MDPYTFLVLNTEKSRLLYQDQIQPFMDHVQCSNGRRGPIEYDDAHFFSATSGLPLQLGGSKGAAPGPNHALSKISLEMDVISYQ